MSRLRVVAQPPSPSAPPHAGSDGRLPSDSDGQSQPMKVFMHWDMEGVSGILSREQVWFWEEGVREDVAE